uniref:Uncharacterized protein n=1 Tax=Arundo donax TaxID=35708 RepID=A0A0A8ZHS3_ARUDO
MVSVWCDDSRVMLFAEL